MPSKHLKIEKELERFATLELKQGNTKCEDETEASPTEEIPSYYHFDLNTVIASKKDQKTKREQLARGINRYMLENGCYDPRRYRQFPAQ